MDAIEKTKSLTRQNLNINLLVPQEVNPNAMGDREFNLLCDNLSRVGFIDPVFVRPLEGGKYRIIGGYHRWKAAEVLGFEEVPCTIVSDPDFDGDLEKFQIVRMNMIRGKLSPEKFLKLYESLSSKYEDELLADSFGFADEEQFTKMVKQMSKSLPKEMQAQFTEAAKDMKTIDGLTKLLNSMFNKYGDTLPYGYMMVDFGGKDSVWLRMSTSDMGCFTAVAQKCVDRKRSVDSLFRLFMQSIAGGALEGLLDSLNAFPEVTVKAGELPLEG